MPPSRKKKEEYNPDWESEIAAYDAECSARDAEFSKKHMVIKDSVNQDLTPEENEVFELVLKGATFAEIAEMYDVEEEVISGLMEIIRAKLSLSDT
jgi:DNA-binding CsgD family transcriptional regulator